MNNKYFMWHLFFVFKAFKHIIFWYHKRFFGSIDLYQKSLWLDRSKRFASQLSSHRHIHRPTTHFLISEIQALICDQII